MVNNLVLTKAQNAVTAHDWGTAARLYKELLRKDESNIDFLKELGNIYVRMNDDEKAIPYYEQIITFQPSATDAMISLGAIYRRLKRYEESISILQRALDEGHNRAMVNYTLGFTYKDMKNYEDAIDAFESVISVNPDDVLAYNHLGSIYFEQKAYTKSINIFTRGLQVDPNHPILNYNLARCYEAAKNYPDAVRCYENALKTRPGWADAIRDFSELLIKCQFTKQAQILVEQSIKLNPNDVDLLCILGRIYLNQFDYDNATKTFKKANKLRGSDVIILMGLSEALEKNEKISQALETAIEAMDISPENKDVRKRYVHALLSSQRYAKALEVLKSLDEETDGKDLQVMDLYGQYFICRGDEQAANTYYEKIKKQNHHYKDFMLNAADRYIQMGNLEKAATYANDFIECRSQLPDGYNRLGQVYRSKGELKTARDEYEKGITLRKPNIFAKKEIAKIDALLENQPIVENSVNEENIENQIENETENENVENTDLPLDDEESILDYSQFENAIPALKEDEEKDFWDNLEDMNINNPLLDEESDPEEILSMMDPDDLKALENDDEDDNKDEFEIPTDEQIEEEEKQEQLQAEQPKFEPINEAEPVEIPTKAMDDDFLDDSNFAPVEKEPVVQKETIPEEKEPIEEQNIPVESENPLANEETPIEENSDDFWEDFPSNSETTAENEDFKTEENLPTQIPQEIPLSDNTIDSEMSKKMLDNVDSALTAANMAQQMAQDVIDSQLQLAENLKEQNEKLIQDAVEKAIQEKLGDIQIPEDDFELDLGEEDSSEEDIISDEEISLDDEISFEEDEVADDDENISEEDEISIDDENLPTDEEISLEDEISIDDDNLPADKEIPLTENDEIELTTQDILENPTDMLEKIGKILNDDDLAAEYSNEIELFKTLSLLSNFLPESERYSFNSCRMRMKIEYIISKMSGKPGLLETAESLLKSGVLGEEFESQLEYDREENEITNEMIRTVILAMQKLSENLEDKNIATAMKVTADGILEQIELENQKSAIF